MGRGIRLNDIKSYDVDPLILLTAKADTRDIVNGLGAGADDYLTKPSSNPRWWLASARCSASRDFMIPCNCRRRS
jgi:DNA-binding response OmpR family regulator